MANRARNFESEENDALILPDDCWRIILAKIPSYVPIYLVSRTCRRIFCQLLDQRLAKALNVSIVKAQLCPKIVKRLFSQLDVFLLLEKAISADPQKQTDLVNLAGQLKKLAKLSSDVNKVEEAFSNTSFFEFDLRFRGNIVIKEIHYDEDIEGDYKSTENLIEFYWFGAKGRYIEASITYTCYSNLLIRDKENDQHSLRYHFEFKKLGTEEQQDSISEDRVIKPQINPWRSQTVEKVVNWLGFSLDRDYFWTLCPQGPDPFLYKKKTDPLQIKDWNVDELKRVMQLFLSNVRGWQEKFIVAVSNLIVD